MTYPRRTNQVFPLGFLTVLALGLWAWAAAASAAAACPNEAIREAQHSTRLSECRAYEMVSPAEKSGGNVIADPARTQTSLDGSAFAFESLSVFAEAAGTSIATSYMAERSTQPEPGADGWSVHATTPPQSIISPSALLTAAIDPRYEGDYTQDLGQGVFAAWASLGEDAYTADVPNLYLRTDLRNRGAGSYRLITACPVCAESETPLSLPPTYPAASYLKPFLIGGSSDRRHIVFESQQRLTADAPPQPTSCGYQDSGHAELCRMNLYEWEDGEVRLADRVPAESKSETCDDAGFNPCVPADDSSAGKGRFRKYSTPHAVSSGSDGHSRTFFTQPTDQQGHTASEALSESQEAAIDASTSGNLYVRIDGTRTEKLNVDERIAATTFHPATYLDASADGKQAFFMTSQALTENAPDDGVAKLYMWSTTPDAEGHHLSFLSPDGEPKDGGEVRYAVGSSADGNYFYFVARGQLVHGKPTLAGNDAIYLWHEGSLTYIAKLGSGEEAEIGNSSTFYRPQSRVSPDGRHLLFPTISGAGVLSAHGGVDYNQGSCISHFGIGCRELYLYSAEGDRLQCVSCRAGVIPAAPATITLDELEFIGGGGSQTKPHETGALSGDGRLVFFTTAEALVPEDTNGVQDAYVYDSESTEAHLLSSGTDHKPSIFLEATPDGHDAFFATFQPLLGWDSDTSADVYDARIEGGFPEPVPVSAPCEGESCAAPSPGPPSPPELGSISLISGNRCKAGFRTVRRSGKLRCVHRNRYRKNHQPRHKRSHHKGGHE